MADTVAIQIPRPSIKEGHAITATAYFRTAGAASTPTNVRYRLDNLTSGEKILDWTAVTAAANVSISITPIQNAIRDTCNRSERIQLTVDADHDLTTQVRESVEYDIENLGGF